MLTRVLACCVVLAVLATPSARAQLEVDRAVQEAGSAPVPKLKEAARGLIPGAAELELWAEDGRVFAWHIGLTKAVDLAALGKEAGTDGTDVGESLEAWSTKLAAKLVKITTDEVQRAGTDKGFNPGTDVKISVGGHILTPEMHVAAASSSDPTFYWISFTGTRRNPGTVDGKVVRAAEEKAHGGDIKVVIEPERAVWAYRETITGRITITNTSKVRVHLSAWWIDGVDVTNLQGETPKTFDIMGNIDPGPNQAQYVFLEPGEVHTGQFSVYTDRAHSMKNGYYLEPGEWLLRYAARANDNIAVDEDPIPVTVRAEPGEYTGPRILDVRGAGPNLVLLREGGSVEVVEAASGKYLATKPQERLRNTVYFKFGNPVFSGDGRLVAYNANIYDPPISVESLFGPAPPKREIEAPDGLTLGVGGFTPLRFGPDESRLICRTNHAITIMDLTTGQAVRTIDLPKMWIAISPDASGGAALKGLPMRIVGYRGTDRCTVAVLDLNDQKNNHEVTVTGHGTNPELHAGKAGVYLCDEFASSVAYLPYAPGEQREFQAGGPAEFVGESPDGSVVVFAWPFFDQGRNTGPTTVGVYRVTDGKQLCTITAGDCRAAALLADPPRIVTLPYAVVGDEWGGGRWMREAAKLYDAATGELIRDLDLTPPIGADGNREDRRE